MKLYKFITTPKISDYITEHGYDFHIITEEDMVTLHHILQSAPEIYGHQIKEYRFDLIYPENPELGYLYTKDYRKASEIFNIDRMLAVCLGEAPAHALIETVCPNCNRLHHTGDNILNNYEVLCCSGCHTEYRFPTSNLYHVFRLTKQEKRESIILPKEKPLVNIDDFILTEADEIKDSIASKTVGIPITKGIHIDIRKPLSEEFALTDEDNEVVFTVQTYNMEECRIISSVEPMSLPKKKFDEYKIAFDKVIDCIHDLVIADEYYDLDNINLETMLTKLNQFEVDGVRDAIKALNEVHGQFEVINSSTKIVVFPT